MAREQQQLEGMSGRPELSVGDGTPLDEAVSSLIKELRRSKPVEALYWAMQLHARYGGYLWRRLAIFAAEDVSIANPDAIVAVQALHRQYDRGMTKDRKTKVRKDVDAAADAVRSAVWLLANTPKCRESNFVWGMLGDLLQSGWRPEAAADMETTNARKMLNAVEDGDELTGAYFARLVEEAVRGAVWDPLIRWSSRYVAPSQPATHAAVSALGWGYELVEKGSGSKRGDRDCLSMAVLLLARAEITLAAMENQDALDARMRSGTLVEVPEYALDGHTKRGKKLTPVSEDRHRNWFMVWSRVEPNVGPHDAELWHLRRLATGCLIDSSMVDQLAAQWKDEGSLIDPTETRYPVIEGWRHP